MNEGKQDRNWGGDLSKNKDMKTGTGAGKETREVAEMGTGTRM